MNMKETIRKVLKEKLEDDDIKILRRLDFDELDKLFKKSLDICSTRYVKYNSKFNAMTPFKFKQMVISQMMESEYGNIKTERFNKENLFIELWDFLLSYYSEPMEKMFRNINKISESIIKEDSNLLPASLRRRMDKLPNYIRAACRWLNPKYFDSFEEFVNRVAFSSTRDFIGDFGPDDYENNLLIREKLIPFVLNIIEKDFIDEIREWYEKEID